MKAMRCLSIQPNRVQVHGSRWCRPRRQECSRWRSQKVLPLRMQRFKANYSKDDDDETDSVLDDAVVDFDDLVLDDAFYKEIGEDKEMLEKHPPWAPEQTDPQGFNVTFDEYLDNRKDIPDYIKSDLRDAQYFGPPVLLLAGFHLEELPMMRLTVDKLLGKHVKVIPVFGTEVLNMSVEQALELPEPDWSGPRPSTWKRDATWGSRRTIVFGGLPIESQAVVVEVIEESGLPPVCCTIASVETRNMKLGNLLADAIKLQRDRKNPEKNVWEIKDKMVDDITDLPGYYADKITKRVKTVQDGLQSGEAVLEEDEKTGVLNVKMDGLKEEIFDVDDISKPATKSRERSNPPQQRRSSKKSAPSKEEDTKKKSRTKSNPGTPNTATGRKNRRSGNASSKDAQTNNKPLLSVSDLSAVDDLICDELGVERPQRPKKPSVTIPPPYKPPKKKNRTTTPSTGNVYPISTEPDIVEEGVKRSTVFSGLVSDASTFMKDNFGYDIKEKGDIPSAQEKTITVDVRSLAEQEAINFTDDTESLEFVDETETDSLDFMHETEDVLFDDEAQEESLSVEEVIQSAIGKGVDPKELQRLIEGLPSANSTERSKLRNRLRQGRYNR